MSLVVLISGYVRPDRIEALRRDHRETEIFFGQTLDELLPQIDRAEVLASAGLDAAVAAQASRLRWWHTWAAGPDQHLAALAGRPVLVTCSKGNGAIPLAEHALMLMLMLNRQSSRWTIAQAERRWDHFRHAELNGLTCGIVGLGNIGADLALKARAMHMRVLGIRRRPQPMATVDEVRGLESLPWLLAESDVVVQTAPLTPQTAQMFGSEQFRMMRPGALFICVSRGGTYDEQGLADALADGHLGGAGLDAHPVEPLPADSPLWTTPNTIITPHNGGSTPQTIERAADIFVANLARYLAGRDLMNVVDMAAGY
jgi:phosphoglycerate dehydrogenase-like enzyme